MVNEFPDGIVPYEMQMIKLARYLNTTPWELERQALHWYDYGSIMQIAESRASGATYTEHTF
jgi:hypothetical protein